MYLSNRQKFIWVQTVSSAFSLSCCYVFFLFYDVAIKRTLFENIGWCFCVLVSLFIPSYILFSWLVRKKSFFQKNKNENKRFVIQSLWLRFTLIILVSLSLLYFSFVIFNEVSLRDFPIAGGVLLSVITALLTEWERHIKNRWYKEADNQ